MVGDSGLCCQWLFNTERGMRTFTYTIPFSKSTEISTRVCPEGYLTLSQTSPGFYVSAVQVFENTVVKGEIVRNEQSLLFTRCFLPVLRTFCHYHQN